MSTIVVPIVGKPRAVSGLSVARPLAALAGATVHLVHVTPEPTEPARALAALGIGASELAGTVVHTPSGVPAETIVRLAGELGAAFIVMSSHEGTEPGREPLGDIALAVLKGASCPLVLLGPGPVSATWAPRRILLPHDGTPSTSAAVRPAGELARRAGAELTLLHVVGPEARASSERGALQPPRYLDQPQHEWPAWLGEFVERTGASLPLAALRAYTTVGREGAGAEVLRYASEHHPDLIVLAWRSDWREPRATEVKAILLDAPCPVMVCRI